YMHDGSIKTLEEVLDHYARGGRLIESGPNAGDGKDNPNKSALLNGFVMTEQEKQDLLAFLGALTDETLLDNPAYSDPFAK
ncbi:MAG: di-heme enzyme, partial [Deltaproteobacteria bacterium]|nr:di-heme enzyme [Deltaproteobacteria bacterium]MBW1876285.1 di-heme enzyme [Deltaproteobacteria bacterium]